MKEVKVDSALDYVPPADFKNHFPWSFVGFDDRGGPVLVVPIGQWNPSRVSGMKEHAMKLYLQYFETIWKIMRTRSKGKDYIPQFTVIIDCEGLGWKHYTSYDGK
jgi:hypothetical protein